MAVAPAPAAHAVPAAPNAEASAAAAWLSDAIGGDGLIPGGGVGGFFYGANLDFGISLAATGQAPSAALTKITDGIDATVADYVGDINAAANAGKVAHAAYFYAVTGGNASDAGDDHLDLAAALAAQVDDTTGQLGSTNTVYNQVWAVFALKAIDSNEAAKARDFLVAQRGPAATDGWGYDAGVWTNDVDATSWALQALAPWQSDTTVKAAIDAGATYLRSTQKPSGGIDAGFLGVNANSTGLAAYAFGLTGRTTEASAAASWVAAHQSVALAGCGVPGPNAGAIAYDDLAFAGGVTADEVDQAGPATAQALEGLAYLPAAQPSLPKFADAGTTNSLPLQGARTGQQVCVTGLGAPQQLTAPASATYAAPAGTADHPVTLTFLGGSTTTTLKALDATRLKVKVATKLKANKKATIKVKGLAAGESVSVKIGKKTATGTANANGVAKVRIKVKKKGKAKVKVVGQFPDRKGKATTRVV
ncbi:hypothetical protein GCM10023066_54020 [Nocardioides kongjuensis]